VRNEPQQARSREKLSRILDAADQEFGEHGYANAQMTAIARRAEIAAGTLYRFFPDKQAIAEAMAERYQEAAAEVFKPLIEDFGQVDLGETAKRFVESSAELQELHPGYFALGVEHARNTDSPTLQVRTGLTELLAVQLEEVGVGVGNKRLRRILDFCFEVTRFLLFVGPRPNDSREEHVAEVQAVLSAYVTEAASALLEESE